MSQLGHTRSQLRPNVYNTFDVSIIACEAASGHTCDDEMMNVMCDECVCVLVCVSGNQHSRNARLSFYASNSTSQSTGANASTWDRESAGDTAS